MSRLVNEVLDRNRAQSAEFCSSSASIARRFHRETHPTEIAVLKCMDGRLDLALMTRTPPGIIYPFRSMGGKFSMGLPWFGDLIDEWINYAIKKGRRSVVFVTYHFSRSNNAHLGCKGWGYDLEAAQKAARALVGQIEHVYGKGDIVYPVVVGIETDEDALILHGKSDLDLAAYAGTNEEELKSTFRAAFPDMHSQMLADVFELVRGNVAHIREVREKKREPIDMDHRENIIVVGRGFELHMPNRALIIGPYDYGWPQEVAIAGKIVLDNIKAGRASPEDGCLLLCSSAFRKERGTGRERPRSELRARDMASFASKVLAEQVPELKFDTIVGTVDMDTRELFVLD